MGLGKMIRKYAQKIGVPSWILVGAGLLLIGVVFFRARLTELYGKIFKTAT